MSNFEKKLLLLNFLIYSILAVFSYCFVDLNLTISQNHLVLNLINKLQQIGYYQRPISSILFLIIVTFAFSSYAVTLFLAKKNIVGKKYIFTSTAVNTIVLIFAYPFLSYDIFNYIFDARIIFHYHLSPYTHKALDFPQDDLVRFMRWTHRYSPYGPLWLIYSLVPYALGFGKFIITLFSFKIFIGFFHLINTLIIYKTLKKIKPNLSDFGTAIYALNPLLLIEGVANSHNDVVLATFLILPIYFIVIEKKMLSLFLNIIGFFIKYISILVLPWFILNFKKEIISVKKIILINLFTLAIFTYFYSSFRISVPFVSSSGTQVQFQPWYLFWTLPFISLLAEYNLVVLGFILSFGSILRYLPLLYYGDWNQPGTLIFIQSVIVIPIFISTLTFLILRKKSI